MARPDWSAGDSSGRAKKAVNKAGYTPPKIKPSEVGSLHSALGVPQGQKLTASEKAIKPGDSEAIRKKKQFAINAGKWKH